jgi:toxin ParE1/3/4
MTFKVSKPAKQDLDEIWLYIAQDSINAADRFIDYLTERFPLLASSPRMGRSREDLASGLRCHPVKNYLILYRLVKNRVEIARVVHGARG